jgi:hypothetical protein
MKRIVLLFISILLVLFFYNNYKKATYETDDGISKFLEVYTPVNNKIRYGNKGDGGYVIAGGLEYDLFISGGISDDSSFENKFLEVHDVPAYAYDGTIENPPVDLPTHVNLVRKNIDDENNLYSLIDSYENVFVKMDIEGHEWHWFYNMPEKTLSKIKQMSVEFHRWDKNHASAYEFRDDAKKIHNNVFEKLAKTHNIIHIHGNNNASMERNVPVVAEITYVRKDIPVSGRNTKPFPHEGLDFPNISDKEEIILDGYPYVHI